MPGTVGSAPLSTSVASQPSDVPQQPSTAALAPPLPSTPLLQSDSQQIDFSRLANLLDAAEVDDSLVCPPGLAEYLHSWTLDEMTQETGAHVALTSSGMELGGARVVITGPAEARARAKLHVQAWMDVNMRLKGLIGPAADAAPPAVPLTKWPPPSIPGLHMNGNGSGVPDGFPPLSYPSAPVPPHACAMPVAGLPPGVAIPEGFPPGMCPLPEAGLPPVFADPSPASIFSSQQIPASGFPPGVPASFSPMSNGAGVSNQLESPCALGGNLGELSCSTALAADLGGLSVPLLQTDNGNAALAPSLGLVPPGMSAEAFDEL